jgi:hypothetical protein
VIGFFNYCFIVNLISFLSLYSVKKLTHGFDENIIGMIMGTVSGISLLLVLMGPSSGPSFNPYL